MANFFVYFLCLLSVTGIGYLDGSLVFPERCLASSGQISGGEKLYLARCAGCHPGGKNIIDPASPIIDSKQIKDLKVFTKFVRNPSKPDGTTGIMPAFPEETISDRELQLLYQYVTHDLAGKH